MLNNYWLNLAVNDVNETLQFYDSLGLKVTKKDKDKPSAIYIGKQVICIYEREVLEDYVGKDIETDNYGNGLLLSFSVSSNEAVDKFYEKLLEQQAEVLVEPSESNGYYGMMFVDVNGYMMNIIVMEEEK